MCLHPTLASPLPLHSAAPHFAKRIKMCALKCAKFDQVVVACALIKQTCCRLWILQSAACTPMSAPPSCLPAATSSCSCLEALEQRSSSRNHLGQAPVRADMCRNAAQHRREEEEGKEGERERRRAHINSLSLPLLLAFIFVRVPTKNKNNKQTKT